MSDAASRLRQIKELVVGKTQDPNSIPWDPESTSFPSRKDLPRQPGGLEDAAWVWGADDFRGRLNLLTPSRIKAAASEIQTGESARLDLPLDEPEHPSFGRQRFHHEIVTLVPDKAFDDVYTLNTQSGTQWDGFRHVAHQATNLFYNNTRATDITGPNANDKCSIHHWSSSGSFSGRAVLLDYRAYAASHGIKYDTCTNHAISHADLEACGKHQNLDIRPQSQGGHIRIGDILLIRTGWTQDHRSRSASANAALAQRTGSHNALCGLKQEPAILDWLHDCYFSAVAADCPTFECWPFPPDCFLHEYLLALWGVPIGEMLDLERVSELAAKHKRWTCFFVSAPANCPRGVSSHVNGTAIF